jgi:hypothetical protein
VNASADTLASEVAVFRTRTALVLAASLGMVGALAYGWPRPDAPAWLAALAGGWPTLWFAAGLVLAGTALARGPKARRRAAAGWSVVALATEALQHPALASLLFPGGPAGARFHPSAYAHRGTFDAVDLVAALLGGAIGWALAGALDRDGPRASGRVAVPARGVAPATTGRLGLLACRGALLALAAAATVATSAPPGPYVAVTLEPSVVCEGDEVRVAWSGYRGDGDDPPARGVLNAVPPDAFAPPLVDLEVVVPGALDVVAERSGGVAAEPGPYGTAEGVSSLVHARPCDAAGRQYRHDDADDVVALAAAPSGAEVVAVLRGPSAFDRLVRLDAAANEVATAFVTGERGGRVRDVAVAPDGTVVAVGWRPAATDGSTTEAVVWRWPRGGAPDDGTAIGPMAPAPNAEAVAVAIDAGGRTWVAWTEGPPARTFAAVGGYAPDGAQVAAYAVAPDPPTRAIDLAVDALGRPTLLAQAAASATTTTTLVAHALDADGTPRWTRGALGWGTAALASGASGTTLLLIAEALHALDDATGATLWTTVDPEGRTGTHLAVDDAGAAVVAGPGPFLQRYAADGAPANGRTFGSARADVPGALAWSDGAVVGGSTEGALATTLDPDGLAEAFVLRFPAGAP